MASSTTQDLNEIRIAMVGKTGVGKSEVGNSLLQEQVFVSASFGSSVTSKCKFGTRILEDGYKLVIVDTPGLFDTRVSNMETSKELVRCIALTSPGPHVFLFVMTVGRFTNEERDTINNLKDIFGKQVMDFVIILFTCKDKLAHGHITLDQYIEECTEDVKSIIEECEGRYVAINNYADPVNREKDVQDILNVVRDTMQSNKTQCYTGAMYEAAEEIFKEKLQKIVEEKHKREMELDEKEWKLEKDVKEKFQKLEEEMKKQNMEHKKREMENEIAKQENEREKERNEQLATDNRMKEKRQEMDKQRLDREMEKRTKMVEEERFKLEKMASEEEKTRFEFENKELKMQMEIEALQIEAAIEKKKWTQKHEESKMELERQKKKLQVERQSFREESMSSDDFSEDPKINILIGRKIRQLLSISH